MACKLTVGEWRDRSGCRVSIWTGISAKRLEDGALHWNAGKLMPGQAGMLRYVGAAGIPFEFFPDGMIPKEGYRWGTLDPSTLFVPEEDA